MKKFIVVFLMMFSGILFAQQTQPFTVATWIDSDNSNYNTRIYNELSRQLNNSDEFYLTMEDENKNNSDIHIVIRGLDLKDGRYAWGVSICPIHEPIFNNVATFSTEASISGVNWLAREVLVFIEETLYLIYDYYSSMDEQETLFSS